MADRNRPQITPHLFHKPNILSPIMNNDHRDHTRRGAGFIPLNADKI